MRKARQPSALPTRKLAVGSAAAAIVTTYLSPAVTEVWDTAIEGALGGPAVADLVGATLGVIVALLLGYNVPDAPNIDVSEGERG